MARVPRKHLGDGTFHVGTRATDYNRLFEDHGDYVFCLRQLLYVIDRFEWDTHAFCLMGTHLHLVVACRQVELSAGMKILLERNAMAFNRGHGRRGHLVANRFWARTMDESELHDVCTYVHWNPVEARLVEHPDDWPWTWNRYAPPGATPRSVLPPSLRETLPGRALRPRRSPQRRDPTPSRW